MTEDKGGAASAGALLRAARERQGLHIAALAASIKVAPRKLDALENNRWDELPDATFARALAQTMCRSLKIDARPVLALLPPVDSGALEDVAGHLNMPFNDRPDRSDGGMAGTAIRPMVWAAALLMVAAVAVYFVPEGLWPGRDDAPSAVASQGALPTLPLAPASAPLVADALATSAQGPALEPAPVALAQWAPSAPAPGAVLPQAMPALPTGTVVPGTSAARPADAATGPVRLHAMQLSWVDARDGRGQVLLSRTLQSGETLALDGTLPIRLTIGNASGTQLSFRGKAVDLSSQTQGNVARVELQ